MVVIYKVILGVDENDSLLTFADAAAKHMGLGGIVQANPTVIFADLLV